MGINTQGMGIKYPETGDKHPEKGDKYPGEWRLTQGQLLATAPLESSIKLNTKLSGLELWSPELAQIKNNNLKRVT